METGRFAGEIIAIVRTHVDQFMRDSLIYVFWLLLLYCHKTLTFINFLYWYTR